MEIFYELMMKNGSCFLVGTNDEGICEFSINGQEFSIYTEVDGEGEFVDFSFSVATFLLSDKNEREDQAQDDDLSVLSVRKVDEKRKRRLKEINRKAMESVKSSSFGRWGSLLISKKAEFSASRGCINTPNGWIFA